MMIEDLIERLKSDKKVKNKFLLTTVTLKLENNRILINHGWSFVGLTSVLIVFIVFFIMGSVFLGPILDVYVFIGMLLILTLFGFNVARLIDGSGSFISNLKKNRGDIFSKGLILEY